jgi:hypothetical protein|tara:strand:- start:53 stop:793 length:741 start_codon:yes stop_codon:yes gene_type:complete
MKTVYWATGSEGSNVPDTYQISELKFADPVRVSKGMDFVKFFGPSASKCPAVIDESKNTFKINSPVDMNITFSEDFTGINSKYQQDFEFIKHFIGQFGPDGVIQLSAPSYLFFCEEPLTMTQLPPYYEQSNFVDNCIGLSATFNINSWFRPVKPSFKLRDNKRTIDINTTDALMYLKFNTEEKVKLIRFDASSFMNINAPIMQSILGFKMNTKNPHAPTGLMAGYEAFIRARYNKRIIKIIKENLL